VLRDRDLAPSNVITNEWVEAVWAARQAIALVLSEGLAGPAAAERRVGTDEPSSCLLYRTWASTLVGGRASSPYFAACFEPRGLGKKREPKVTGVYGLANIPTSTAAP